VHAVPTPGLADAVRQRIRPRGLGRGSLVAAAAAGFCLSHGRSAATEAWSIPVRHPTVQRVAHSADGITGTKHARPTAGTKVRDVGVGRPALPDALLSAQTLVEQLPVYVESFGPTGPLLFFVVFVLLECLSLPASPLLLSSGYIFGLPVGCAISLVSLCTAASISFFLARTVLRPQLMQMAKGNAVFEDINCAVQAEGFKIIFLLRLAPLLPFALSNYAYGLTKVDFKDFLMATALGCAPLTIALVYIATVARDVIGKEGADTPWYYYAVGIVATVALLKVVGDVAQKAVADSVQADRENCELDEAYYAPGN